MRLALPVLVFTLLTLGAAPVSHALTISLDPPLGDSPFSLNMSFSALNGTAVNGQSLSLDFRFATISGSSPTAATMACC